MQIIQVILILFSLFALSRVILNIRNRTIHLLEGLFWCGLWTLVAIIGFFPDFLMSVARIIGIDRGVDILVYLGLVLLAYLIFRLYAKLEGMEKRITKIIRTIAIKNNRKKE